MAFKSIQITGAVEVVSKLLDVVDSCDRQSEMGQWANAVLSHALRQFECFIEPEISTAAADMAHQLGHGDLKGKWYGFQDTDDDKQPIFHWEHVRPVSDMKARLIALPKPRSAASIEQVLRTTDVAWILKTEDRKLTTQKYRTARPEDAWQAYRDCGIRIVGRDQGAEGVDRG